MYLGEYDDETAAVCNWSLPLAHPLESWSDCVNDHGYYGICQPQILPLMGGRTIPEVIALALGEETYDPQSLVRATADEQNGEKLSEQAWRRLLHDGYSEDMKLSGGEITVSGTAAELPTEEPVATESDAIDQNDFEVVFCVADGVYDGRFANNGWLQEMPQSITKLTWGNAAIMSPASAKALGIRHGLTVSLRKDGNRIELPVFEIPGIAPGVVVTSIGYGRTRAGNVGGNPDAGVDVPGFDVSSLRTSDAMSVVYGVEARPNFNEFEFATTQDHWAIDELGKDETEKRSFTLVREGTMKLLDKVPTFANEAPKAPHVPLLRGDVLDNSLDSEPIKDIRDDSANEWMPQWGMSIDLTKCTGCNACVIACQSENNIPIVGPEQVKNSREMHWLRLDRYFQGDEDTADVVHQPMACIHCETAPCEQVCPVAATVHTNEGINAMAYNRCIGTRYCANNCPVKVRRFNYFNYNGDVGVGYGWSAYPRRDRIGQSQTASAGAQPRSHPARPRRDGKVHLLRPAGREGQDRSEQRRWSSGRRRRRRHGLPVACSTGAIEFGNIADPESAVAKKHADPRALRHAGAAQHQTANRIPGSRPQPAPTSDDRRPVERPGNHRSPSRTRRSRSR